MNPIFLVFKDGHFVKTASERNLLPAGVTFSSANGVNTIILEENSQMTLVEEYSGNNAGPYATHSKTEITLKKHARMDFYKLQNEGSQSHHHAHVIVHQAEASSFTFFTTDCGSLSARTDLRITLSENYAECHLNGLYLLNQDNQDVSHFIQVDHAAPFSTSYMCYKGILDKKSRALFNGKVHVHKKAQHSNAFQANHNLLLSNNAEVSTQPQLEIYADDIKCSHGATVGQLDTEALFYLQSRGIEEEDALKMLTHAFTTEIIDKITNQDVRQYVREKVGQYE